jgi:pimeloyl-ACP methyl ester carboxylesterase
VSRAGQFTALHRGGSGGPLVCLHGFADTWRTWDLVLPALERRFDVLAVTLAGHAGGPALPEPLSELTLADAVEAAMDEAGFGRAHMAGNSLGGYVALQLAARGRALSVTAFAPAGGYAAGDPARLMPLDFNERVLESAAASLPHIDAILATRDGRRAVTAFAAVNFEHIPAELLVHQALGTAACTGGRRLIELARARGWPLELDGLDCPVRIVWGTRDRLLRWPRAAARFREEWLPSADWVVLEDVGHCPQLDVPDVASGLIADFAGS